MVADLGTAVVVDDRWAVAEGVHDDAAAADGYAGVVAVDGFVVAVVAPDGLQKRLPT